MRDGCAKKTSSPRTTVCATHLHANSTHQRRRNCADTTTLPHTMDAADAPAAPSAPAFVKSATHIQANQHVLVRLPSEALRIVKLKPTGSINLGKFGAFETSGVFGHPFGSAFEVLDDRRVRRVHSLTAPGADADSASESDAGADFVSADNNQHLVDAGSSTQTLSLADIDALKAAATGTLGQAIIDNIIAGHGQFDKKTVFSQQKYLRRKQQKFLRRFSLDYLGPAQLLRYYLEKEPQRVLDLSEETLALILAHANVRPGGNYLVVDDTGGILVYAMLERMRGSGHILVAHENEHANNVELRHSDYSEETLERMVSTINLLQVVEPENEKIVWEEYLEEELAEMKPNKRTQYYRRKKRASATNAAIDAYCAGNFDAVITVSALYLPTLLPYLIPALGGLRPLVTYSAYKELLLETQHALASDKRILAPLIFETRVRPYQTIPGRMHPVMTMKGFGGYVMAGTRVFPKEGINAVGRGNGRKKSASPAEEKRDETEVDKSTQEKGDEKEEDVKMEE